MKEFLENIPKIELALLIIGVFVLIIGIIFGCVMAYYLLKKDGRGWHEILTITTRLAIAFVTSSRGNAFISICSLHPYSL